MQRSAQPHPNSHQNAHHFDLLHTKDSDAVHLPKLPTDRQITDATVLDNQRYLKVEYVVVV